MMFVDAAGESNRGAQRPEVPGHFGVALGVPNGIRTRESFTRSWSSTRSGTNRSPKGTPSTGVLGIDSGTAFDQSAPFIGWSFLRTGTADVALWASADGITRDAESGFGSS